MGKHAKRKAKGLGKKLAMGTALTTGAGLSIGVVTEAQAAAPAATTEEWDTVAACESGGDWSINYSGDGMSVGGLQFQNASWQYALEYLNSQGYDTSYWTQELYQGMPASDVPTKYQTILAAEALLHLQGAGAWVCPGVYNSSMFDGGPTPSILESEDPATMGPDVVPSDGSDGGVAASEGNPSEVYDDHLHHTVEPGDTLYNIAKIYLGDGHKWGQVYNVPETRETVGDNPHLIYPGQDIRVNVTSELLPKSDLSQPSSDEPSHSSYVHPVGGASVSQPYGNSNPMYTLGYHTGTDFSASSGTNAVAITGGTVVDSDTSSAYGVNVQVKWDDGTYGLYAHLSGAAVSPGDTVAPGDLVGYVGSTGTSSGPHLHFEIRTAPRFAEGNFLDPVQYLRDNGLVI
jgi:nucleoid-associated protein YgaU